MPATAPTTDGTLQIQLDRLFLPDNVRDIDDDSLEPLERSIRARGKVVVPVEVLDADPAVHGPDYDYVLVAGFRRTLAARRAGLKTIRGVYGDAEQEEADRALENIARKQLNPYEEAVAVRAMLDRGHTEQGAAELLEWDKRRVTARMKLLELPQRAQQLVGQRVIPLAAIEPMRVIAGISPPLLDAVIEYVDDAIGERAEQLGREPLSIAMRAVAATESDAFGAPLREVPMRQLDTLELDEATLALAAEATELHQKLDRFSCMPPRVRFTDAEVDRARAAGVLIEYGHEDPLVTDFAVYQELCRTAIDAAVQALRQRLADREPPAAHNEGAKSNEAPDQVAELDKAHRRERRDLAATAHSANLDLGDSLRNGLSTVDPSDITVARFLVYALLGLDHPSIHDPTARISAIALRGIRLVVDDFREDVTKTKKDGSAGALRITYGDGHNPANQIDWLWNYLKGAKTAGELYGRALVVIAAEHYASRSVLPASQQFAPLRWPSHKDMAVKALEKIARPHVASTLKALERAVAKATRDYDEEREALSAAKRQAQEKKDRSAADGGDEPHVAEQANEPDAEHAPADGVDDDEAPCPECAAAPEPEAPADAPEPAAAPIAEARAADAPSNDADAGVTAGADVVDASAEIDF
jgi:ParB/RepB/Spo0J family partition protein